MSGSTRSTPGSVGIGKGHADIDDDPFARVGRPEAVEREIHADLADAAKRHEDEFGAGGFAMSCSSFLALQAAPARSDRAEMHVARCDLHDTRRRRRG